MRVFLTYCAPMGVYFIAPLKTVASRAPTPKPTAPSRATLPQFTRPFSSILASIEFAAAKEPAATPLRPTKPTNATVLPPAVRGIAATAATAPTMRRPTLIPSAFLSSHPLKLVSFATSFGTSCVPHGSISPTGLFPQNAYVSAKNPVPVTAGSGSADRNRREAGSTTRAPITSRPAADTLPAPLNTNPAGNPAPAGEENSASTLGRIVALGVPQGFIPPAVPTCENPPSEPGAGMPPAPITEGISATGFGSHTSGTDAPSAPVT